MNKQGNILIVLILISAFAVGVILYMKSKPASVPITNYTKPPSSSQSISTKSAEQIKTFQSKNLKFTITIPLNSQVQEKNTYVDVIIEKSIIDLVRNGTNFSSLKDYLKDYDTKKNTQISNSENLEISGNETVDRIETNIGSGSKQKVYYIYVDNWIYSISTSSESVFNDLDQIAQTFRYTP